MEEFIPLDDAALVVKKSTVKLHKEWSILEADVMICPGTLSQAHKKLKARNEQGASICVMACAFASMKKMNTWAMKTLDQIIELGTLLHVKSRQMLEKRCTTHITPSLVYKYFFLGDIKVSMKVGPGVIKVKLIKRGKGSGPTQLAEHLLTFFENNNTGIVAFNQIYFAVWVMNKDFFFVFDPMEHTPLGEKWQGIPSYGVCYVKRYRDLKAVAVNIYNNVDLNAVTHFKIYPCVVEKLVKVNTKPPATLQGDPPHLVVEKPPPPKPNILEEPLPKPQPPVTTPPDEQAQEGEEGEQGEGDAAADTEPRISPSQIPPERPRLKSITNFRELIEGRFGILRAKTHQNDTNFAKYPGTQCYPNALAVLTALRLAKSKTWVRSTLHEVLKLGEVLNHDLKKLKPDQDLKIISINNQDFTPKVYIESAIRGILTTSEDSILSLEQVLKDFFLDFDCAIILSRLTLAVWKEDDRFYMFDPNDRNAWGRQVQGEEQGFACVTWYTDIKDLVSTYLSNVPKEQHKDPFVVVRITINDYIEFAQDFYNFKALDVDRWILRGTFSQNDRRFLPENRNAQCTAMAAIALTFKEMLEEKNWTTEIIDQVIMNGDEFYRQCVEYLREKGRFRHAHLMVDEIKRTFDMENKRINLEIDDCLVNGIINADLNSSILNLGNGFKEFFEESDSGIVTANGFSMAVWKRDEIFYYFDSHTRDEDGLACTVGTGCLLRLCKMEDLVNIMMSNFGANRQNLFNISRVVVRIIEITEDGFIKPPLMAYDAVPDTDYIAILRSNFDEKHKKFGLNAGKQTIPMCLTAISVNMLTPSYNWTKEDLDQILIFGDKWYFSSMEDNYTADLPEELNIDDITTNNVRKEFKIGTNLFQVEFEEAGRGYLEDGLKGVLESLHIQTLQNEEDFQTFQSIVESQYMTVALWRDENLFYLFDPKARDSTGQVYGKDDWSAKSVIIELSDEEEVDDEEEEENEEVVVNVSGPNEENVPPSPSPTEEGEEEGEEEETPPPPPPIKEKKGSDYWRSLQVDEGKACVLRFSRLEDLYNHIMENAPPRKLAEVEFVLKKVAVKNTPVVHEVFDPENDEKVDETVGDWHSFKELDKGRWILRGHKNFTDAFYPECNRGRQEIPMCIVALAYVYLYSLELFKDRMVDIIMMYGDKFCTTLRRLRRKELKKDKTLKLSDDEIEDVLNKLDYQISDYPSYFCMGEKLVGWDLGPEVVTGDFSSKIPEDVLNLPAALLAFFQQNTWGILFCRSYHVAIWADRMEIYYMFDPHPTGPSGQQSPLGVGCITRFMSVEELADVFIKNLPKLGNHFFTIQSLIFAKGHCPRVRVPEEEVTKVLKLGGFTQVMSGKSILRGTTKLDCSHFNRGVNIQSAAVAYAALAFSLCHDTQTWTRMFIDQILRIGEDLYKDTLEKLGDRFDPWSDILDISRVNMDFPLGNLKVNCALRFTEQRGLVGVKNNPKTPNLRQGLERFFEENSHGILIVHRLVLAIWEEEEDGSYFIYMYDPNSRGPTGLPTHAGTPCAVRICNFKLAADHVMACLLDIDKVTLPYVIVPVQVVVGFLSSRRKKRRVLEDQMRSPSPIRFRSTPARCPTRADIANEKKLLKELVHWERLHRDRRKFHILGRITYIPLSENELILRGRSHVIPGRECPINFAAYLTMQLFADLDSWNWKHIELTMEIGNQLYVDSYNCYKPETKAITIEHTLRRMVVGNLVFKLKVLEPMIFKGFTRDNVAMILSQMFILTNYCSMNFGTEIVSLYFKQGFYYMFDPAPRDLFGNPMPENQGTAMMMRFSDLEYMVNKLVPNLTGGDGRSHENSFFALLILDLESATPLSTPQ